MSDWGTLRSAFARERWWAVWDEVERFDAPAEDVAKYLWDLSIQDLTVAPVMHTCGVRKVRRQLKKGDHDTRIMRALAWWDARIAELEAKAWEEARRTGEPAGLIFMPHDLHTATVGVPRDVFDRMPGTTLLTNSTIEEGDCPWGPLIQEEYRFVMTPDGAPCLVARFTEVELRHLDRWYEGTEDPERIALMASRIEVLSPFGEDARLDPSQVFANTFDDVLTGLRIAPDDIVWCPDEWVFEPHVVMRQDDNGHDFEVGTFPSRHAAAARVRQFESAMHKQHYWVERAL